jgi:hypothetical protein
VLAGIVTVVTKTPLCVAGPIGIRAGSPKVVPNSVAEVPTLFPLMHTIEKVTDEPGAAIAGVTSICGPAAKAGTADPANVAIPASVSTAPAERMERIEISFPPNTHETFSRVHHLKVAAIELTTTGCYPMRSVINPL